jgi:glycine betaine/choline ABC-type transport system substrate-binding protein
MYYNATADDYINEGFAFTSNSNIVDARLKILEDD